jgi:hypothetical protein
MRRRTAKKDKMETKENENRAFGKFENLLKVEHI